MKLFSKRGFIRMFQRDCVGSITIEKYRSRISKQNIRSLKVKDYKTVKGK